MDLHVKALVVAVVVSAAAPAACGSSADRATTSPKRSKSTGAGGGGAETSTSITTDSTAGAGALCDATCEHRASGEGSGEPFTLDGHESAGVVVGDDGSVSVVAHEPPKGKDLIWIVSSKGGYVSKFDTSTYEELARVATGKDPSRTAVDAQGDVYVASRGGESAVKVSASSKSCPDTNGDGKITTSTGQDLLPFGGDDCMLWVQPLGHVLRGAAAQQRPAGADGVSKSDVWVGTLDGFVWKLDGDTGEVLLTADSPCPVYGLALDGAGQLWMTNDNCLGRIDTTRCLDDASCAALGSCTSSCSAIGSCTATCDDAGREAITLPGMTYGITVDFKGRVWLGGLPIQRYSPHGAPSARLASKQLDKITQVHGIAADGVGFVWAAAVPNVVRLDAETLDARLITTESSKGMAVDRQGKIWVVSEMLPFASVIFPGTTIGNNQVVEHVVTGLDGPYTYSDLTGVQVALATGATGRYVQRFTGCGGGETAWIELGWKADVPAGSLLRFRARTAENAAAIASATWVDVAAAPSGTSPTSLAGALTKAKIPPGHLLDVEVTFTVAGAATSPKLEGLDVGYVCPKPSTPK